MPNRLIEHFASLRRGQAAPALPVIPGVEPGDLVLGHLDNSIAWFEGQSMRTRGWHFGLRGIQLVLASAIPFSQVVLNDWLARSVAGAFGAGIAICQGWDSLHRYGDHHVSWRATAQQLKRERFLFSIKGDAYAGLSSAEALSLLAKRVVSIEISESQDWQSKQLAEGGTGAPRAAGK